MEKATYQFNCVGSDADTVNAIIDRNREITRRTFTRHVDLEDLKLVERSLGYDKDFRMTQDWHVSYHKSRLDGKPVYYFRHSAIEFVFA